MKMEHPSTMLVLSRAEGLILRQAQDDNYGVMVSLSNHDGLLEAIFG